MPKKRMLLAERQQETTASWLAPPLAAGITGRVSAGEHCDLDAERERGGPGRVVRGVPVHDVRAAEKAPAAEEQPAFDLYVRPLLPRAPDSRDLLLDPARLPAPLDVRVVRLEGGPLGADPRDPVEVVPRRRTGRRPFQRARVPPRVFLGHLHPVPPGDVHVPQEYQDGQREDPRPDGGDEVD